MSIETQKKTRQMPKGGRKGGTSFPRVALSDALGYAKKLVTKTHSTAQPQDVIFSGVVGAKSGKGGVRISALKQYGLMKGDAKALYAAQDLAKQIHAAPPEELPPLYQKAVLRPAVFKKIFDAFHGDVVTKAKLKQRAADLNVHPDETGTCVDLYISGMTTAGLVSVDGDKVTHLAPATAASKESEEVRESGDSVAENGEGAVASDSEPDSAAGSATAEGTPSTAAGTARGPRAVFNVNVTLDSSLDIEKLQKQLELLKRFGAI